MRRPLGSLLFAYMLLSGTPALAATTWVVTSNNEAASLASANCNASTSICPTLRDAVNQAASNDTIRFAPSLDGQTIALTLYTNCLTLADTGSATCLPPAGGWTGNYVHQFGPSAFFIPRNKTLTIDATADVDGHAFSHGVTLQRSTAGGTANFRLFDVDAGAKLVLTGLRLSNGIAAGGNTGLGGGALGAGGAIFSQGQLFLLRCALDGNIAQGGSPVSVAGTVDAGGGVGGDASLLGGAGGPNSGAGPAAGGFGGGGDIGVSAGELGGFGGGGGYGGSSGGGGGFGAGAGGSSGTVSGAGGFGGGNGGTGAGNNGAGGGGAGMGGAIFNDGGYAELMNVTVTNNRATGGAGSNGGSGYGGAVFNYAGTLSLDFATVSGNSVGKGAHTGAAGTQDGNADGGAVYSLADTQCANGGNTCASTAAAFSANDSIVIGNTGGGHDVVLNRINGESTAIANTNHYSAFGPVSALNGATYTTVSAVTGAVTLGAFNAAGSGLDAVMMPGGAAIDVLASAGGQCPIDIDQRGMARPNPGSASATPCDIGAVEAGSGYVLKVTVVGSGSVTAGNSPAPMTGSGPISNCTSGGSACSAVYAPASGATLTASAVAGAAFSWSGDCSGSNPTANVTMNAPRSCTATYTQIAIGPNILALTYGVAYNLTLTASGGTSPYAFALSSGSPPPGMTLLASGTLSGTPTQAGGPYAFTVSATDAHGFVGTRDYSVIVSQADSATALTSSTNPSVFGQPITFRAAVSVAPPAMTGTPGGSVAFFDGAAQIGTGALSNGVATFTTSTLATGNHTITARYAGDANFNSSAGALDTDPQVVNKAGASIAVTSSANPAAPGQSVVLTITVAAAAPGGDTPGGTVTLTDGSTPLATLTLSNGSATYPATFTTLGAHTISAAYSGDGNHTSTDAVFIETIAVPPPVVPAPLLDPWVLPWLVIAMAAAASARRRKT